MRINLNQLNVFYAVGRHKQMTEAAKELYVSTPAVTMQIKKLEAWLNFPLFERGRGSLRFTERGQALFDAIGPVFKEVETLESYIQNLVGIEQMEIKLGTHHLPGNYFVSDMISHVCVKYPLLRVSIELERQDALLKKLAQQELDLVVIIGDPPADANFIATPLFDEALALVTSAHSELANLSAITVQQLAEIPLILQQKGTGARRVVVDFLHSHGVQPTILLDNLSSDVIKQFLPKMQAAALIGRFIVQSELESGAFHEIQLRTETPPVCRFHLVSIDSPHVSLKIRYFLAGLAGFTPSFKRAVL